MIYIKSLQSLFNNKATLFLVPVISACLFVTIITIAPTTVMGDSYPKTIQSTMGNLYPKTIQIAQLVSPEEIKSTPAPETAVAVAPSTPPPNATPRARTQPSQPSRGLAQPVSSNTSKASAIIATAKQYIGVNYVFGGTTPSGFDCSGFSQYVFAKNGINLPRVARDQYRVGSSVPFSNLRAGDLVFFSLGKNGNVDHMGIYVGNGQFINASSSKGVTIYSLGSYWQSAYVGAKRVL